MKYIGIDAGSTYTKIALLNSNGSIEDLKVFPTTVGFVEKIKEELPKEKVIIAATGYCRNTLAQKLNARKINEIKAHAVGVRWFIPEARTVIDLGGQDSKVIRLKQGGFSDFITNDRCAAGTGRFLEMAAARLGIDVSKLSELATKHTRKTSISSMCAVFAESEIISLLSKGERVENICYAIMDSIASRLASMVKGFGIEEPLVFTGGGALNESLKGLMEEKLGVKIQTCPHPQFTGAVGAALLATDLSIRSALRFQV